MSDVTLHTGDCLEWLPSIPDASVDMVMSDPPYGTTACKWDTIIALDRLWPELLRVTKPFSAILMMSNQPFTTILISSKIDIFKYCWIWEKSKASNFIKANFSPLRSHEEVCVFSNGSSSYGANHNMMYNPQKTPGKSYDKGMRYNKSIEAFPGNYHNSRLLNQTGERYPRSVLYFPTADSEGVVYHPTQKPIKLMSYLIRTYTNNDDTVLDFCMGSGTTGVACVDTDRKFIGGDLLPEYVEIARKRIDGAKYIHQNSLFNE